MLSNLFPAFSYKIKFLYTEEIYKINIFIELEALFGGVKLDIFYMTNTKCTVLHI